MEEARRGDVGHESKNPYYEGRKYKEPTFCTSCGLVYREGRWINDEVPEDNLNEALCPACRRKRDKNPEGLVYLSGDYLREHKEEIIAIARNNEKQAKSTRPLQQIMWANCDSNTLEIATTNEHLARRIGKAIKRAHDGKLEIKSANNERLVRVYWAREE